MQNITRSGRRGALPTSRLPQHQASNAVVRSVGASRPKSAPKDVYERTPKRYAQAIPRASAKADQFEGLVDAALIAAIKKATHAAKRTLDYSEVREIIFTKLDNIMGIVHCVYTDKQIRTTKVPPNDQFNVEHILPQSRGAMGEAKSDLNHLAAADSLANNKRGNLHFGIVKTVLWEEGGSKMGTDAEGREVFEPRAQFKGNAARAMFYAAAVYGHPIDAFEEKVLRQWAKMDPVDDAELARSKRIATFQGQGNFFVEQPELIDRIKDI